MEEERIIFQELINSAKKSKLDLQTTFQKTLSAYNNDISEAILSSNKFKQSTAILKTLSACDDIGTHLISSPSFANLLIRLSASSPVTERLPSESASVLFEILNSTNLDTATSILATEARHVLISTAVEFIASSDLASSNQACFLATSLLRGHAEEIAVLVERTRQSASDSTIQLRFLSVLARVAGFDDEHFEACARLEAVRLIWDTCKANDILVRIVALELLSEFSKTNSGLKYLLLEGIFSWLIELAEGRVPDSDPISQAQSLREIANILRTASEHGLLNETFMQEIIQANLLKRFLHCVLMQYESSAEESRVTGLRVLSDFVTSCSLALTIVMNDAELLEAWLSLINGKVDCQVATLSAVARVLDCPYSHEAAAAVDASPCSSSSAVEDGSVDPLKRQLLEALARARRAQVMTLLMKFILQPIASLRGAALNLLRSVVQQSWGLALAYASKDFREYVVNPDTEHSKECREWKYALLEQINQSPQLQLLAADFVDNIRKAVARGPFYAPARMEEMLTVER